MFSRHADAAEVAAELARLYPSAPPDLAGSFEGKAPRKADRLAEWVHEQVRRAAVLEAARRSGADQEPYPADGEDALRVYLPDDLTDAPVDQVPAAAWQQARDEAWGDHGDALAEDRLAEWSDRLAEQVAATLDAWRSH
jgi:hypothetical protein